MTSQILKMLGLGSLATGIALVIWFAMFSSREASPTTNYVPALNARLLNADDTVSFLPFISGG